ncbi:type II toxin-antitoxin system Phd/YefM family antitoxin [Agrococcus sp. Ld7]|uniref:type II toxin-antitoxin system Phd/YefM family antitoxin n=1 Tax=Agrococcus sp. Ld7 TaxID=649148 RepID=UPI0038672118
MRTVSVRELRQNPAQMLRDVEAGESYTITSHNRPIARVEPVGSSTQITPPKRTGRPNLASLPPHELRSAETIDEILDDLRGSW